MQVSAHAATVLGSLTILVAAQPAAAQATTRWRVVRPGPAGALFSARQTATDSYGNVFVSFGKYYPGSTTELAKYSPNGELLWQRSALPIRAVGLVSAANGDAVLCGETGGNILVLRVDAQGHVRWRRMVFGASPSDMVLDSLDGVVVVGSAGGDWLVQPFASDGTSSWAMLLDGPQQLSDRANCVSVDAAGDLLVGGSVGTSSVYTDAAVAKISGAGQLQWMSHWSATFDSESYTSIVSDGQGGAIAAGRVEYTSSVWPPTHYIEAQITRFDALGNVAWIHPQWGLGFDHDAADVIVDGAGQIWAAILVDPYFFSMPVMRIERISAGGATLSSYDYDGPTHAGAWPIGLQLDGAGRVLVGATSGDPFSGADNVAALMRMEATGVPAWTWTFAPPGAGLRAAGIRRSRGERVLLFGELTESSGLESDALVIQLGLDDPP